MLKLLFTYLTIFVISITLVNCGTAPISRLPDQEPKFKLNEDDCNYSKISGCLDVYIVSNNSLIVNNRAFDDAHDFNINLVSLIHSANKNINLQDNKQFAFSLQRDINNKNFVNNFTYSLEGERVITGKFRVKNKFSVENLDTSVYNLTMQKHFQFTIKNLKLNVGKTYCARLSTENDVEIKTNSRTHIIVKEFKLKTYNRPCSNTTEIRDNVIDL